MKKFAIAAVAAAAGVANAYTVGTFNNGFVVPNVYFDANETTAVGLTNQTGSTVAVYWTFFDQNSNHVQDGCFTLTDKDYEPFVWNTKAGFGLSGARGYLTFIAGATTSAGNTLQTVCGAAAFAAAPAVALGASASVVTQGGFNTLTSAARLSGNAFQVNSTGKSVAFVPVIDGPVAIAATRDITTMDKNSVAYVGGAAQVNDAGNIVAANNGGNPFTLNAAGDTYSSVTPTMTMRYFVDNATGGTDTRIVVWSTGTQKKSHTVNVYDDKQNRQSVNFVLSFDELDNFDPETIVGRPSTFVDGFVDWTVTAASLATNATTPVNQNGSIMTYSVISAPAFGAVQTVLGSHR